MESASNKHFKIKQEKRDFIALFFYPLSMNYLGHIYLSGDDDQLMIGNFIGDYIKGKKYLEYPEGIQRGIVLHRDIDTYTDNHRNFQLIRNQLKPIYGLYSGVVADLFVDHFLAANWKSFHPDELGLFTQRVYKKMKENYHYLPERIQGFFSNFVQRDRLLSYAQVNGIEEALMIMAFKSSLPERSQEATSVLREQYPELKDLTIQFLKEITMYVK